MTNVERYQEIKEQIEEQFAVLKVVGEKALRDLSSSFFESHPEIESFSWTQYTPYWNDGEPCEFGAYTKWPELVYAENVEEYSASKDREMEEEISSFLGIFADDHLKLIFGDHAQISVNREGVEVSEYDHE